MAALKKICLYRSFDRYGPYGHATFYGSHKITVLIWPVCFSKGISVLDVWEKKFKRVIFVLKIYLVTLIQWFNSAKFNYFANKVVLSIVP